MALGQLNYRYFRVLLSNDDLLTHETATRFLYALHSAGIPNMIWQFTSDGSIPEIYCTAGCQEPHLAKFQELISIHFPNTDLEYVGEHVDKLCNAHQVVFKTQPRDHLFMFRTYNFNPDPLRGFTKVLEMVAPGDWAAVRFEFAPVTDQAEIHGTRVVVPHKASSPLWYLLVWLWAGADTPERADAHANSYLNGLYQILRLFEDEAHWVQWEDEDIEKFYWPKYQSLRKEAVAMLNTAELVNFIHLPNASVECAILKRAGKIGKPAPEFLTRHGLPLGINSYRRIETKVYLPADLRSRHIYVVGASGSGKSTLLTNTIKHDLEAGEGLAVIDPHGDLIADILPNIPEHRTKDTVYFNPSDREFVTPFNVLDCQSEEEADLVADALIVTFRRLVESWGDRMENILRNVVYTLIAAGGKTFADIRRILIKPEFREQVLAQIANPMLLEFWYEEFPNLPKNAVDPITNKFTKFLSPLSHTRFIFSHPENKLNFADILQNKKILFANLSQGTLGLDTSHLLGSFLISHLQMAAMRRAAIEKESRTPFSLYIDEFQNYTAEGSTFEKMLSEARKYNLQLVLAHQFTSQLSTKVADAIFGNVFSMILFRVGVDDAAYLQKAVTGYTAEDLQNLSIGQAVMRCGKAEDSFNLATYPPPAKPEQHFAQAVINHSRQQYAIPIQAAQDWERQQYKRPQARAVTLPSEDVWS